MFDEFLTGNFQVKAEFSDSEYLNTSSSKRGKINNQ